MNILFNNDRLQRLIGNLHTLTGIWANIFDISGKDIQISGEHNPFCRMMNDDPEGHARCEACDARAVKKCAASRSVYRYRCHAGICEVVLPIYESGVPIAYLVFGQLLDDSPREEQWERAREALDWFPGDREALRRRFFDLKQYSDQEITAYTDILAAIASYILLEGIIHSAEYTDAQKLDMYLEQHYMESLSIRQIAGDLHIGTTKLCALAKKLSDGGTLTRLIAQRRVNAAKTLLLRGNAPICAVAEEVGFVDYNYFTKVFRLLTGETPSAFRKRNRQKSVSGPRAE